MVKMMKKQKAKQSSYKRNKLRRLLRSRLVMNVRRRLANCKKWVKRHLLFWKKKPQVQLGTLDPIFQAPNPTKKFLTFTRIVTFMTLFIGVGGTYLWFQLTSQSFDEKESSYFSDNSHNIEDQQTLARTSSTDTMKSDKRSLAEKPTIESQNTAFSMQPYIKLDAQIPLIKTINPQFFIQAADNKAQKVAILIVGLGINEALTDEVLLRVPKNVSLVFSPYSPALDSLIEFAQYEDFSVLVAAPLEDEDPVTDQGYLTLKTRVSEEENIENLKKITLHAKQADCIYGQGGARLLRSAKEMKPIFEYMREVNNCFVAPPDILVNRLHEVAAALQLNYACTTIENPAASMMPSIEALTKRTGFSILAFDAKPGIVDEIKEWIKKLEQAKLSVVPITEIIHH